MAVGVRHHAGLLALLLALVPVVGFGAVWSADEGALLYQAAALEAGDGWEFDHPFPEADPTGTYYPVHLSSWSESAPPDCEPESGQCRYVVLAKHVGFLWVAAALYGIGGYPALLVLSVLGTVAAAAVAARLTTLIEPRAAPVAFWITGVASPLLIDAYVAWAHTIGAALIGWGVYWLVGGAGHQPLRPRVWRLLGAAMVFLACLVRTEAALMGLAIAIGLPAANLMADRIGPGGRRGAASSGLGYRAGSWWGGGLTALAATIAGLVVDRMTATRTAGPVEPADFNEAFGLVAGRIEAFTTTWLLPGYRNQPRDLLLLAGAGCILAGAVLVRRGSAGVTPARIMGSAGLVALTARFVTGPEAMIPGLVVAFPVLFVGLVLLRSQDLDRMMLQLLVPFGLFCGAVLATQYRGGGGGEWGGRYFALGLPLGIAVASVGLFRTGRILGEMDRRRLAIPLAISMALLSVMGLMGLRTGRVRTQELAVEVNTTVTGEHGSSVVVTTVNGLGRWMWSDLDRARWLRVPSEDLDSLGARLRTLNVEQLTLVSADTETDLALLSPWYAPAPPESLAVTEDDQPSSEPSLPGPVVVLQARR